MKTISFDPYVRFVNRRHLTQIYPNRVCAFDYRLFYAVRGAFDVELEDRCIRLEPSSLLTVPPGVGYRLIPCAEPADFYIINFDFDASHGSLPARPPVAEESFDEKDIFSQFSVPPFEEVFHLPGAYELESVFHEIDIAEEMDVETARHIRSGLMKYLLSKASYLFSSHHRGEDDTRIQAIKTHIEQNYAQHINNRTVATEMGYHPHYLNAFFLASEGITLHAYIESVRIKHAKELLATTQKPIYEIAQACGFSEPSYFVKFFSRHVGMTPKHYRGLCM